MIFRDIWENIVAVCYRCRTSRLRLVLSQFFQNSRLPCQNLSQGCRIARRSGCHGRCHSRSRHCRNDRFHRNWRSDRSRSDNRCRSSNRRRTGRSGLLHGRSRLDRMRNHRLSCPLFMTAASHLPGDAGVDHIFTATHTAANRQNRRIIGMIISPDSHGIGVMIAAVVVLQR